MRQQTTIREPGRYRFPDLRKVFERGACRRPARTTGHAGLPVRRRLRRAAERRERAPVGQAVEPDRRRTRTTAAESPDFAHFTLRRLRASQVPPVSACGSNGRPGACSAVDASRTICAAQAHARRPPTAPGTAKSPTDGQAAATARPRIVLTFGVLADGVDPTEAVAQILTAVPPFRAVWNHGAAVSRRGRTGTGQWAASCQVRPTPMETSRGARRS
ncbi:hypothetical protein Arub01_14900 [Actinomadura rubrobrunea]|uniref:Uncharacterized protein n=1 Tax=Actinomadura rubrobrunea TaxID=115335 RepID=A0A9W6PUJ1_9ACTN|nr:hypothetical protein Arub01_14900 [Actinomadura rubrobrunea]